MSLVETPEILVDGRTGSGSTLHHVWNQCAGAGRANEALRADWQAHFAEAVERLGFRSVRFHGLFHDDMFVYRDTYGGGFGPDEALAEPVHTFSYVDKVFDVVVDAGVVPFVELGFMPRGLATTTETVFWWGAHCSPPTDMSRWLALVTATVEHWVERYGLPEVRRWKFEVWNEPNLVPHFWTGTRSQYFELYEQTARAVKAVDGRLAVGGPSTSVFVPDARYAGETEDRSAEHATAAAQDVDALDWRPVWIEEFLTWCQERDVPVDFVSTHLYPTDFAFGANGESVSISRYADATRDDLVRLRALLADSAYPHAETHITEWSTSPSSRDAMHDTVFAATYVARAYLRCAGLADSISYWTFTDVFEEGGAGIGPFHGGFGLVTEQGIHKPTFHALAMLARLGDAVLLASDSGVLTRDSTTGDIAGLFVNYPAEMGGQSVGSAATHEQTRALAGIGTDLVVRHTISGLAPGSSYVMEVLDLQHGDVCEAWRRLGSPRNLSRGQEAHLRRVADALDRTELIASRDGVLEVDITIAPWALLSLRPLS
ncbi:hypothetical protein WDZ16_02270 [Pseudokineococcus marinus]|uniref:Beta-xylosidase n=1 Tax=Pseudokineococcus marinus TaxID=351215 RepID=A0A849BT06_9ACTN|nr:beta-xylosidase [Pseudokineococcus marinus]NNH22666.1 beta-xylosidase [Pseudokineococcus marinus]